MVVDPQPNMTYQPFLPEAAAGSVEPRHVVVPLRRVLKKCRVITGAGGRIDARPPVRRRSQPVDGRGLRARLRPAGGGARLDRPDAADPRAGRAGHRLQDHRRGDLPAQPRAVPAGLRRLHRGPGGPAPGADLRLRRRRLRRRRGDGRAGGHGPLRLPVLPEHRAGRHALGAGRGGGPDHARGVGGAVGLHRGPAARARHRRPAQHPAGLGGGRARSSCPTARRSRPTRWSGRPG